MSLMVTCPNDRTVFDALANPWPPNAKELPPGNSQELTRCPTCGWVITAPIAPSGLGYAWPGSGGYSLG